MFRPPTVFYAGRKVSDLRRHLVTAGHPMSLQQAQQIVALAWGYISWSEFLSVMDEPAQPSPYDEDLEVPVAEASVLRREKRKALARRRSRTTWALMQGTGLPMITAQSLCHHLRIMGRFARRDHDDAADAVGAEASTASPRRSANDGLPDEIRGDIWMTPEEFKQELARHIPAEDDPFIGLSRDLQAVRQKPSSMPPHRPR